MSNQNSSLQHYGIKGQHWGVRRFQNEDCTLTAEGKNRYRRHLDSADILDKEDQIKKPQELKYHAENKQEILEKFRQNPHSSDAEFEQWYNARKKYLEDTIKNTPRDMAFNQKMRQFLDTNASITVDSLRKQIQKTAKETGLDADWVKKYYDENLDEILGIK